MFENALPDGTKSTLAVLEEHKITRNAYLAGGTGLALQLGHRVSKDLDFFTCDDLNEEALLAELGKIPGFSPSQISAGTILGSFSNLRFSFFHYDYPLVEFPLKYQMTNVAGVKDIGAMKILACVSRGTKRDFIDLYFLCRQISPLENLLGMYDSKYGNLDSLMMHIKKSLVYFIDAEQDEMPAMIVETEWEDVKRFFIKEVKKLKI